MASSKTEKPNAERHNDDEHCKCSPRQDLPSCAHASSRTHRVVLQPFAHFLAVLGQDEPIADQALEGWLAKQGCGEHHESVEPAPCLINACTVGTQVEGGS